MAATDLRQRQQIGRLEKIRNLARILVKPRPSTKITAELLDGLRDAITELEATENDEKEQNS